MTQFSLPSGVKLVICFSAPDGTQWISLVDPEEGATVKTIIDSE